VAPFRCLCIAVAVLASLAGLSSHGASAAPPPLPSCTPTETQSVTGAHFIVYYTDDPGVPDYASQAQAGNVLAAAERAYDNYLAAGFPTPAVGVSGKTELYLLDLGPWKLSAIYCTGTVVEDTATVTGSSKDFYVGTDVFTQVERQVGSAQTWLMNGAAAWASWRALGYPVSSIADIGPFDMTLDCDSAAATANCSNTSPYENLGGSRWPFYEYLAEKYGPLFIVDIFSAAQSAAGNGLAGLQNALIAKGTTLGTEYGAYAAKLLTHSWTASTLNAATVPVSGSRIQTGISSGAIPSESFGINHLSTKFVEIDRGDGSGSHACYAAALTLTVQIPNGVTSQPTFYWAAGGGAPVSLVVTGNTASATVPWDTCAWQSKGYLALPNTSFVDGTSFVVSGTLSVDFSTPATAAVPPAAASQFGPTTDASSFSATPTLTLYGPQVLKIAANATQLRLIVASTGEGAVSVTIGSTVLGTSTLTPGGNDLRFMLPETLLHSLRRSAGSAVITLTPIAPDSTTKGAPITRKVSIATARPKSKPKPKRG
jgi:hypothetical protein